MNQGQPSNGAEPAQGGGEGGARGATAPATQPPADAAAASSAASVAGKYLSFVLAGEEYGVEILKVREILGMMSITAVPQTPLFVKGVINLRGKVIPVVDLRLKFGMEEADYTQETCVIVVEVGGVQMGIIVDTVHEVVDITADQIEDAPSFGVQVNTEFIRGMGKVGEKVKILLDIERVLTSESLVVGGDAA